MYVCVANGQRNVPSSISLIKKMKKYHCEAEKAIVRKKAKKKERKSGKVDDRISLNWSAHPKRYLREPETAAA